MAFLSSSYTPRGLERERIPAVAHLAFAQLGAAPRRELLISEMRTQTLMVLPAWAPPELRKIMPENEC